MFAGVGGSCLMDAFRVFSPKLFTKLVTNVGNVGAVCTWGNHIDEKLGVRKGKIKLNAAIISGVFYSLKYMLTSHLKLGNISPLFLKEKL